MRFSEIFIKRSIMGYNIKRKKLLCSIDVSIMKSLY